MGKQVKTGKAISDDIVSGGYSGVQVEQGDAEKEYLRQLAGNCWLRACGLIDGTIPPKAALKSTLLDQITYYEPLHLKIKDEISPLGVFLRKQAVVYFIAMWVMDTKRLSLDHYHAFTTWIVCNDLTNDDDRFFEFIQSMFFCNVRKDSPDEVINKAEKDGDKLEAARHALALLIMASLDTKQLNKLNKRYGDMCHESGIDAGGEKL